MLPVKCLPSLTYSPLRQKAFSLLRAIKYSTPLFLPHKNRIGQNDTSLFFVFSTISQISAKPISEPESDGRVESIFSRGEKLKWVMQSGREINLHHKKARMESQASSKRKSHPKIVSHPPLVRRWIFCSSLACEVFKKKKVKKIFFVGVKNNFSCRCFIN